MVFTLQCRNRLLAFINRFVFLRFLTFKMHVKSYKNVHLALANVKQGMKSDSVFGDCFDTKVNALL